MVRSYVLVAIAVLFLGAGCAKDQPACKGDSQACAGACVSVASDNLNCGACGVACAAGQVCSAGACAQTCAAGLVICNGSCIDPLTDHDFCGASGTCTGPDVGVACATDRICSGGACIIPCVAPLEACSGECVDLQSDVRNCGGCSSPCSTGDVCLAGGCTPACAGGQVRCGADCVDLSSDALHCGACATACDPGFACELGACQRQCAPPLSRCGTGAAATCADLSFDASHCGSCTLACDAGRSCDAGGCSSPACAGILGLPGAPLSPSGAPAVAFALADFDGDGLVDAAVLRASPPTLAILRGDGAGAFVVRAVLDVPEGTSTLQAGDLDGDGHGDLVLGSSSPTTATVPAWFGDGLWGFAPRADTDVATPVEPQSLALADLDGDGTLDLVVGCGPDAVGWNLGIFLNDGAGHLGTAGVGAERDPHQAYSVDPDVRVIGVAELTGNTAVDLLVLSEGVGGPEGTATKLGGFANGTFSTSASYPIAKGPSGVAFADLDGLGVTDWIVSHAGNQLTIFLQDPTGAFAPPDVFVRYDVLSPRAIVAADLDGDGTIDTVTADAQADALSYHQNLGPSPVGGIDFGAPVALPVGPSPIALRFATLGPSAVPHLVSLGADGHLAAIPQLPLAAGGPLGAPVLHAAGAGTAAVATGQLDADALLDAVTLDASAEVLIVWLQSTTPGRFGAAATLLLPPGSAPSGAVLAPLDADATVDLAVALSALGELRIFTNDGAGLFTPLRTLAVGSGAAALVAADLDADGTVDLATADFAGDTLTVRFAPGAASPGASLTLAAGAGPAGLAAADLRGAGCLDLVSANATAGTLTHHPCNPASKGTFLAAVTVPACAGARAVAAGDLDGDGHTDLAVLCAGGGVALRNLGDGTFGAGLSFDGGPAPASIAMGDLDGDGRLDLVLANPSASAVALVRGAAGGALAPPWLYPAGGAPRAAIVSDIDGLGRPDLLVASGTQAGVTVGAGLVSLRSACLP